ncbi:MAG: hypothetical protein KKH01_06850 [Firmicutes bacterium]|nr:hypothetical protein [Bacillota bacterium]
MNQSVFNKQDNYILKRNGRTSLDDLHTDETIFSLANGILGTRGHFTEGYGIDDYPQTLQNGFYNIYPFKYEENYKQFPQEGQTIVLIPDASYVKIETDQEAIDLNHCELIDLERTYDMKKGFSQRKALYRTPLGYEFTIHEDKLVVSKRQIIVVRLTIETTNYSGNIKLTSYLRMPPSSLKEVKDPRLPQVRKHLDFIDTEIRDDCAILRAKTTKTQLFVQAAMTHDIPFVYKDGDQSAIGTFQNFISKEQPLTFSKYQIYTTTLTDADLGQSMDDMLDTVVSFDEYLVDEILIRERFWQQGDIQISDKDLERALLYNTYQLNQSAGLNRKMHISAKGISGEGYEGHYFWDTEAYMLPYFILTQPKKAKDLLLYRYDTLNESRLEARNLGVNRGAKIAWRTINGNESSPYFPAGSAQIHINSDIALAIMNYYYATLDDQFMKDYGIEMLLETAVFLLDYGHFKEGKFHLDSVTGPDEYTAIVNDNYYTNSMAKKHFQFTHDYVIEHQEELQNLLNKLEIDHQTLENLKLAAKGMTLLIDEHKKIIKQDATFMEKAELDIESIPKNHFPLLLNYHPLYIYKHQVLKQADAVLSMVFLGESDLEIYRNTFEYYLKRTTHDSSLSKCIYGIAAYHLGQDELAYQYFKKVALLDLENYQRHTQHGLHAANLGGSYLMLAYGLFGIRMDEVLTINPASQSQIKQAEISINYQGSKIHLSLKNQVLHLVTDLPIKLKVYGEMITVDKVYEIGVKI